MVKHRHPELRNYGGLTDEQLEQIRVLRLAGQSFVSIAECVDTSPTTIGIICKERNFTKGPKVKVRK